MKSVGLWAVQNVLTYPYLTRGRKLKFGWWSRIAGMKIELGQICEGFHA